MTRPRSLLPVAASLVVALACQGEPSSDPAPRVIFNPAPTSSTASDHGIAIGPDGAAPEVVILDPAPQEPARVQPTRQPAPGPQIIYRTVYIEETADTVVADDPPANEPAPMPVEDPVVVAETTPVEPVPSPEATPGDADAPTIPTEVATAPPTPVPTTFPSGGSSRVDDAMIGAAVGASIGAILGGRNGAISGGIGGAIGGATSGRAGGILGGVLGAGTRGRRGGGC